jgi:hypothetical protein
LQSTAAAINPNARFRASFKFHDQADVTDNYETVVGRQLQTILEFALEAFNAEQLQHIQQVNMEDVFDKKESFLSTEDALKMQWVVANKAGQQANGAKQTALLADAKTEDEIFPFPPIVNNKSVLISATVYQHEDVSVDGFVEAFKGVIFQRGLSDIINKKPTCYASYVWFAIISTRRMIERRTQLRATDTQRSLLRTFVISRLHAFHCARLLTDEFIKQYYTIFAKRKPAAESQEGKQTWTLGASRAKLMLIGCSWTRFDFQRILRLLGIVNLSEKAERTFSYQDLSDMATDVVAYLFPEQDNVFRGGYEDFDFLRQSFLWSMLNFAPKFLLLRPYVPSWTAKLWWEKNGHFIKPEPGKSSWATIRKRDGSAYDVVPEEITLDDQHPWAEYKQNDQVIRLLAQKELTAFLVDGAFWSQQHFVALRPGEFIDADLLSDEAVRRLLSPRAERIAAVDEKSLPKQSDSDAVMGTVPLQSEQELLQLEKEAKEEEERKRAQVDADQTATTIAEYQTAQNECQAELAVAHRSLDECQVELAKEKKAVASLKSEKEQIRQEQEQNKAVLSISRSEVVSLTRILLSTKRALNEAMGADEKIDVDQLVGALKESLQELGEVKKEKEQKTARILGMNEVFKETVAALREDKQANAKRLEEMEQAVKACKSDNKKIQDEKEQLVAEVKERDAIIQSLEDTKTMLASRAEEAKAKLDECKIEMKKIAEERDDLSRTSVLQGVVVKTATEERDLYEQEKKKCEEDRDQLQRENAALKKKLSTAEQERDSYRGGSDALAAKLQHPADPVQRPPENKAQEPASRRTLHKFDTNEGLDRFMDQRSREDDGVNWIQYDTLREYINLIGLQIVNLKQVAEDTKAEAARCQVALAGARRSLQSAETVIKTLKKANEELHSQYKADYDQLLAEMHKDADKGAQLHKKYQEMLQNALKDRTGLIPIEEADKAMKSLRVRADEYIATYQKNADAARKAEEQLRKEQQMRREAEMLQRRQEEERRALEEAEILAIQMKELETPSKPTEKKPKDDAKAGIRPEDAKAYILPDIRVDVPAPTLQNQESMKSVRQALATFRLVLAGYPTFDKLWKRLEKAFGVYEELINRLHDKAVRDAVDDEARKSAAALAAAVAAVVTRPDEKKTAASQPALPQSPPLQAASQPTLPQSPPLQAATTCSPYDVLRARATKAAKELNAILVAAANLVCQTHLAAELLTLYMGKHYHPCFPLFEQVLVLLSNKDSAHGALRRMVSIAIVGYLEWMRVAQKGEREPRELFTRLFNDERFDKPEYGPAAIEKDLKIMAGNLAFLTIANTSSIEDEFKTTSKDVSNLERNSANMKQMLQTYVNPLEVPRQDLPSLLRRFGLPERAKYFWRYDAANILDALCPLYQFNWLV